MEIKKCSYENDNGTFYAKSNKTPNFRAGIMDGALNGAGNIMQGIQNGGFLVSFLIQDGLGMTLPRTGAAFLRDKEVTGKYNIQEGFEVLGREGLTGPVMMSIAPVMMFLAAKFGKSSTVNSQLIKRFGANLKEMLANTKFNKSLLNDKAKFEKEFLKSNIEEMLANTVGKGNYKESSVKYIMQQISNYKNIPADANLAKFRGKSKYRSECISNIIEHINNLKYSTASDLNLLDRVKVGSEKLKNINTYSTKDAIDALIKYSDDAIINNKNFTAMSADEAGHFMNKAVGKRAITNVTTMAATLGIMSVLPKIYARSNISPGAKTAIELQKQKEAEMNGEVSFKGKAPNSSFIGKIGEFVSKNVNDRWASEIEYNGHNFTNTLMACLSLGGLLAPRGKRAVERAQVDDVTGKKDYTELHEILFRDVTSTLSVIFLVPILTKALVSAYEKRLGFVLTEKDRTRTGVKGFIDTINPYSSSKVLSNAEINSLYNGVDSKVKMLNFCKYIDKNEGDLQKVLSKSDFAGEIFNKESSFTLDSISKMSKAEKNKKIIEFIENMGSDADAKIKKLMQGNGTKKGVNKIMSYARGLNSLPALITTVFISPFLLGWIIPRVTYANTRRAHEKQAQEREAILAKRADLKA